MITTSNPDVKEGRLSRREFLNLAWLASLGFFLLPVGGVTLLFAYPRFKAGEFGGVFELGDLSALPEIGQSPFANTIGKFWLTRTEDGVRALYKVCTHLGCIYNWQDQENKFICPCHGSQFQKNGTYIQGPAPRSLDRFVTQILDPQTRTVLAETDAQGGPVVISDLPAGIVLVHTGRKILGQRHA